MASGSVSGDIRILKTGDLYGDRICAYYCENCGFIELYKEPSSKEPWRKPKKRKKPVTKELKQLEVEKPSESSRRRLVRQA